MGLYGRSSAAIPPMGITSTATSIGSIITSVSFGASRGSPAASYWVSSEIKVEFDKKIKDSY